MSINSETCGCMTCYEKRLESRNLDFKEHVLALYEAEMHFRYACEICGNKRCPHHSNHLLPCTNSNEPGQPGSKFKRWTP